MIQETAVAESKIGQPVAAKDTAPESAERKGFDRALEMAKAAIKAKRLVAPRTKDGIAFNSTIIDCVAAITEIQQESRLHLERKPIPHSTQADSRLADAKEYSEGG